MIEKKLSNATPLDDENVVLRRSDNNFLNKTQITNCILEAPNGVATYSGSTITVKQGLKFLIPNGRNADGTLNNIETILPNDISRNVGTSSDGTYIALVNNTEEVYSIDYVPLNTYYESSVKPTSSTARRWLDTENNYFYALVSGEPQQIFSTKVLTFVLKDGQITGLFPYQPVELAKQEDIDGMWTTSYLQFANNLSLDGYNGPSSITTFDLSDYLPKDANIYEVIGTIVCRPKTNSDIIDVRVWNSSSVPQIPSVCAAVGFVGTIKNLGSGNFIIPILADRILKLGVANSGANSAGTIAIGRLVAYRKVR